LNVVKYRDDILDPIVLPFLQQRSFGLNHTHRSLTVILILCLCLVIKMYCMYTWWVDCSMSYVNCVQIVPSCCWRGFV
jgi:hypothetical protein